VEADRKRGRRIAAVWLRERASQKARRLFTNSTPYKEIKSPRISANVKGAVKVFLWPNTKTDTRAVNAGLQNLRIKNIQKQGSKFKNKKSILVG
jgi:hypothetical protein